MKQQNDTDQQIIDRVVRDGRRAEYALLVDHYGARIFAFIVTMVTCREDAEELAQDCFVKAYAQLAQYDGRRSSFYTWLRCIAYRLCLDHVRRNPGIWFEADEQTLQAIHRLPPTERLLVQQHYFEQQALTDIAVVTDTDAGTLAYSKAILPILKQEGITSRQFYVYHDSTFTIVRKNRNEDDFVLRRGEA